MEIIAYPQAREILLIASELILPPSGFYLPEVFSAIEMRYEFQKVPGVNIPLGKLLADGAKFEIGKLTIEEDERAGQEIPIQEFTAYDSGLVVVANDTEGAQAFLRDFFSWGELMYGIRPPSGNRSTRLCASQLIVEFEEPLNDLVGKFQSVSRLIEAQMRLLYPTINSPLYVKMFSFDYDKAAVPSSLDNLVGFFIERRLGVPYADNVFFSQTPLPTDQHVEYLTDLEILLRRP